MKYYYTYKSPIGHLTIIENSNHITHVFRSEYKKFENLDSYGFFQSPLIKKTFSQILEYLQGKRQEFNIPLEPKGTDFQKSVWNALIGIPYGQTLSYKEVAKVIGRENSHRAVGNANSKNPIIIIIPCHRVVKSDGSIGGYSSGLDLKKSLINLENKNFQVP